MTFALSPLLFGIPLAPLPPFTDKAEGVLLASAKEEVVSPAVTDSYDSNPKFIQFLSNRAGLEKGEYLPASDPVLKRAYAFVLAQGLANFAAAQTLNLDRSAATIGSRLADSALQRETRANVIGDFLGARREAVLTLPKRVTFSLRALEVTSGSYPEVTRNIDYQAQLVRKKLAKYEKQQQISDAVQTWVDQKTLFAQHKKGEFNPKTRYSILLKLSINARRRSENNPSSKPLKIALKYIESEMVKTYNRMDKQTRVQTNRLLTFYNCHIDGSPK